MLANPPIAIGVTAASATLGPIIPPSLPFVIYGMMANVSIGALFMAGILPGLLMAFLMMVTVAYFAHKNGWGGDVKFSWARFGKAITETLVVIVWPLLMWGLVTKLGLPAQETVFTGLLALFVADKFFKFQAVLPIMTPVLLIGGMSTGIFTPTEASVVAVFYALIVGVGIYRETKIADLPRVLQKSLLPSRPAVGSDRTCWTEWSPKCPCVHCVSKQGRRRPA